MISEVLAVSLPAAVVVILAWRKPWRRRNDDLIVMEAWLETFSPDSYLPMLRLVEPLDANFLLRHRGPEAAARYRRTQRRMLREYLHRLSSDFNRLHAVATDSALRARSDQDGSSLALVEEKMEFIFSMWSIEARLLLSEILPSVVNLRPLLANVDELTAKARALSRRRLEFRVS